MLAHGCSSTQESRNTPTSSWLERIPIVYRQDIQQGNIITQEEVDQLKPGLSKRQVRFLLGTPMLVDVFHQDRWDFVYTNTEGWGDTEQKRITLFFQNDELVQMDGDFRPAANTEALTPRRDKDRVVSVPDYVDPNRGIITKAIESVGSVWEDEQQPTASAIPDSVLEMPSAVPSEQQPMP